MKFLIDNYQLNTQCVDCIIVGIFEQNQLSISAKYLDQCTNGYILSLIKLGDISGKIGQTLLLYNTPNISAKRILLVGCGEKSNLNRKNFKKILIKSIKILKKNSIKNILYCFSELYIKNINIYWMVRIFIKNITESLYNIKKVNSLIERNENFELICLHILDKCDFIKAELGLNHALSIDKGVRAAKDISNLPPNICNPLYLSKKSQRLSQKYTDNIEVELINDKDMQKLGMNAYLAVSRGSKNKPIMSIIKYSNNQIKNNKVIALIGKGVTFDSGGISIKPSYRMHEMKYDMCGAASVYGSMIMAADLKLPLTIIGILAGCENMPGGNAFRPGDVLTTMSGKTVEILNTDAEGRLVLCDVLTYVTKFSPDIVIDIATLTGACVVALGSYASGLFSNDKELSSQLIHASVQTSDKIWQLPLFREYKKELFSNIADLSNIGKSEAGASTAAFFLSQFIGKYQWAHLDIAGTAWRSSIKTGATGRPVELLCQFLLNQSKLFNEF
ncbi:leucyl aminopeptidase [Buchnera aphidicola]|uniref:leucyl aminopeptidase n=1 Tax=Buchnera aphidicola TaxID=9 RepID=UPI003464793A